MNWVETQLEPSVFYLKYENSRIFPFIVLLISFFIMVCKSFNSLIQHLLLVCRSSWREMSSLGRNQSEQSLQLKDILVSITLIVLASYVCLGNLPLWGAVP